jgi:hypothetical protein
MPRCLKGGLPRWVQWPLGGARSHSGMCCCPGQRMTDREHSWGIGVICRMHGGG